MGALIKEADLQHIPRIHIKVRKCFPILSLWLTRLGVRKFDWFEIDTPKALIKVQALLESKGG